MGGIRWAPHFGQHCLASGNPRSMHLKSLGAYAGELFRSVARKPCNPSLLGGDGPSIPTEEVLAEMRASDPPITIWSAHPSGGLTRYEKQLLELPWSRFARQLQVKLLAPGAGTLRPWPNSTDRVNKERAMRRRQLKGWSSGLK